MTTIVLSLVAQPTSLFETFEEGNIMSSIDAWPGYIYYVSWPWIYRLRREAAASQWLYYYHEGTVYGVPLTNEWTPIAVYYAGSVQYVTSDIAGEAMGWAVVGSQFEVFDEAQVELTSAFTSVYETFSPETIALTSSPSSLFSTFDEADVELTSTPNSVFSTFDEADVELTSAPDSLYETFNEADPELTCSISAVYSCVVT